jgi:hypothetical protein
MSQLHKRFTNDQVRLLLEGYVQGRISRSEVEGILEINKTRFFAIVKEYRISPGTFTMEYHRDTPARLSGEIEEAIAKELLREKELIDNPKLPIGSYNYSAIRDRLQKIGFIVSVNTIIQRAKQLDCYLPHPRKKVHDREIVTVAVGALIQHDASTHLWSPYASEKWTLITSLDDYSRMLVYADFVESETSWAHIQAAQTVMKVYGVPLGYYVDNLRVFRFVQNRDSYWRKHVLGTDDVDPQWRQVMRVMGVNVTYALSPQAKGKIERPYRWLQDRIVRTCAHENLTTLEEVRGVLQSEIDRYNNHQVHSTTGEIPSLRFKKAMNSGSSLFRPFSLPKPFSSPKDVFCLHETRTINGYGYITFFNQRIDMPPEIPDHEDVDLHLIPDLVRNNLEIRIWYKANMIRSLTLPLEKIRVHF